MVSAKRKSIDTKRFHHMTGQLQADQYYHIYNARLLQVRETLLKNSRYRWGEDVKNVPLEQLNASLGSTDVFVIGTLFKIMPKQPSILREMEENQFIPHDEDANFTSDEDSLVLHETDENVSVVGDIDPHSHVTGIPVSLLGHQLNGGAKFHVTAICYAGPDLSLYQMPSANQYLDSDCSKSSERLIIISGLEFGFDAKLSKEKTALVIDALKKLRNFISAGKFCGDSQPIKSEIKKLIIAGNSVGPGYAKAKAELTGTAKTDDQRSIHEVFQMFDQFLFTLAQSGVEIDLLPGKNDPTSFLLPQQPFHPKILPKSGSLETVRPLTNPCIIEFRGLTILGTSGENIEAIRRHTKNLDVGSTIITNTLEWGHIAPSAPDNLSCVPFSDKDPFIIDFVPDIYFAGNQPSFAFNTYKAETKQKIQVISVPRFLTSLSCVSVNLESLAVEELFFGADDDNLMN